MAMAAMVLSLSLSWPRPSGVTVVLKRAPVKRGRMDRQDKVREIERKLDQNAPAEPGLFLLVLGTACRAASKRLCVPDLSMQ